MLDKLELFIEIAATGSISKTAANLYTSQSSVSTQLKLIESELGFELFDRIGRGIYLNEKGKLFLEFAQETTERYRLFLDRTAAQGKEQTENLTICGGSYFNVYFLPYILPRFSQNHPDLSIHIVTKQSDHIIEDVMEQKYVFGIISSSKNLDRSTLCIDFTYTSRLLCVCSPANRLAHKENIVVTDINRETFIFTRKNSDYRSYLEHKLRKKGFHAESSITIESIEATKTAVGNNAGITILPEYAVDQELKMGQLATIPIEGLNLTRQISCIHNPHCPPDGISRQFIRACAEYMQALDK